MDLNSTSVHKHAKNKDLVNIQPYHMASSASGQDESLLPKLAISGQHAKSSMKNFPESQMINPLFTLFGQDSYKGTSL